MSRGSRVSCSLVLSAVALGAGAQSAVAHAISVYPLPGTGVASNKTQISFRGIKPSQLGKIVVVGSKTGRHRGKLRKHPGGHGVSFIPNKPFALNEKVRVMTRRKIRLAKHGDFSFRIGNFKVNAQPAAPGIPPEGKIPPNAVTFHSRPDIQAPRVTIDTAAHGTAPGYVFMAPKTDGPMIVDNAGNLVWYQPGRVTDFKVQRFAGKPVLTFWKGAINHVGIGKGTYLIYDQHYRRLMRVHAGNGYGGGEHEFRLTRRGTALITAYQPVKMDLRQFGGPRNGTVQDSIVQEIDLRTNLVLWEWHSLGHVGLGESEVPAPDSPKDAWDYFHVNSASVRPPGQPAAVGPQHQHCLPGQPEDRQGVVAPGRQALGLQEARRGHRHRLAAQRVAAIPRHRVDLRQRSRAACPPGFAGPLPAGERKEA